MNAIRIICKLKHLGASRQNNSLHKHTLHQSGGVETETGLRLLSHRCSCTNAAVSPHLLNWRWCVTLRALFLFLKCSEFSTVVHHMKGIWPLSINVPQTQQAGLPNVQQWKSPHKKNAPSPTYKKGLVGFTWNGEVYPNLNCAQNVTRGKFNKLDYKILSLEIYLFIIISLHRKIPASSSRSALAVDATPFEKWQLEINQSAIHVERKPPN